MGHSSSVYANVPGNSTKQHTTRRIVRSCHLRQLLDLQRMLMMLRGLF
jgi:hypothetical protein